MNVFILFGILIGIMVVTMGLGITYAIWDDYKTGHTRHKEKLFGDD